MAVGKVVKFDEARGFGFIAPTGGTEDVFLHANDLLIPESLIKPGVTVVFDIDEGDRGPKASNIHLPDNAPRSDAATRIARIAAAPNPPLPVPGMPNPVVPNPTVPNPTVPNPTVPNPVGARHQAAPEAQDAIEVLSADEFAGQLTELLLTTVPPLTGDQILSVRRRMIEFANVFGWLEVQM